MKVVEKGGILVTLIVLAVLAVTAAPEGTLQGWTPVYVVGLQYVAAARDARIQGVVRVRCSLNSDGSVRLATIVSGHPIWTNAVLENAREWRFARSGPSVSSDQSALLTYEFKLTDPVCTGQYREQFAFDEPNHIIVTSQFPCWQPDRAEH
ncbi:MAG: TonB family protein [Bryobacteraceae bacterium]|jgi:TonB family protein